MDKISTVENQTKTQQSFFSLYSNFLPPIIAGLISVIVNYGGTFILIFQAAKISGLSPELTASWVWSISIGVGITGILLSGIQKNQLLLRGLHLLLHF